MKKLIGMALALTIVFSLAACGNSDGKKEASAKADEITVWATINIDGDFKRPYEKLQCKDLDGDGFVDVLEVLEQMNSSFIVIHDGETVEKYFTYETSDSGVTITKFYNVEGTNWGIFVDDEPISSLYDAVFDGSHVYIFNYTDTKNYSDTYCFFKEVSVDGEDHTLQLLGYKYDENYNLVQYPIVGAVIPVEGEEGEELLYTTDEEGMVTIPYGDSYMVLTAHLEESGEVGAETILVTPIYYSKLPE